MNCPTSSDIDSYLMELKSTSNISDNTFKAYRADLEHYRQWYEAQSPAPDHPVESYFRHHQDALSPNTLSRRASTLRKFWREMYGENVLGAFKLPKPAKPRPNPLPNLSDDVIKVISAALDDRDWDMALLLAYMGTMGMRISEARNVTSDDMLPDGFVRVRGKGNKEREIPLSPFAEAIILGRCSDPTVRYTDRWARTKVKKYLKQVTGEDHFSPHDLRATAATNWLRKGIDIKTVQELLGHSDLRTTEVYMGVSQTAMKKAVAL